MCLDSGTEFESKPNKIYWKVMREINGQLFPAYQSSKNSDIPFKEASINNAIGSKNGFHAFRTRAAARIERADWDNAKGVKYVIYKVATKDKLVIHGRFTNFGTRNAKAAMFRTMKILEKVY